MPARKVDSLRMQLNEDDLKAFDRLCRFRPTAVELYRFLTERGYDLHYATVCDWRREDLKRREKAQQVMDIVEEFQGIEALDMEEYGAARMFQLVHKILDSIDTIQEMKPNDALAALPSIFHQWRSIVASLKDTKQSAEATEVAVMAAEEVISELLLTFKDTPFFEPLTEACRGARRRIKEKWG